MTRLLAASGVLLAAGLPHAEPLPSLPATQAGQSVVFIAHRGGIVAGYPENTLAAFREAIAHGAEVIEIDLRGTKDGAVVVMHDDTVDRTTNGRGAVADLTLAQVRALDAGGGERVPTYEEVLQLVAGTGVKLLLDIKQSDTLDKRAVVGLTHAHRATLDVIVGPRSVDDLRAFQALDPNLRTIGFIPRVEDIDAFVDAGVHIIRLWPDWIHRDPDLVGRVRRLGRPVWTTAGAAPRDDELARLIGMGVNGILTDYPALMRTVLTDRGLERSRH
jgi:glycerophosphoryl diester phosphodiesterase